MEEKKLRTSTTINPSAESWKRFKIAAIDRDVSLADAVDQAFDEWVTPTVADSKGVRVPAELTRLSEHELHFILAILRAAREEEKRLRQDPDPDAGPIELPGPPPRARRR